MEGQSLPCVCLKSPKVTAFLMHPQELPTPQSCLPATRQPILPQPLPITCLWTCMHEGRPACAPTLVLPLLYVWIMFSAPCFTFSSMASCFSRPATRLRLVAEQVGPPSLGSLGASGEMGGTESPGPSPPSAQEVWPS